MKKHFQMTAAERVDAYTARAVQQMQAGTFPSKAAQKDVFSDLNWAYDSVKTLVGENGMDTWDFFYVSRKAPTDLHNVKERHIEAFGVLADTVRLLMELRAEAKTMEIVKRVVDRSRNGPTTEDITSCYASRSTFVFTMSSTLLAFTSCAACSSRTVSVRLSQTSWRHTTAN